MVRVEDELSKSVISMPAAINMDLMTDEELLAKFKESL